MVAAAIDAKQSNHHTMRVVEFTKYLIEAVNKKVEGPLADVSFSEKEKEELRLAACFHDSG
jgi:response regulator RpfG family c-di-GMP phosphodiesterase